MRQVVLVSLAVVILAGCGGDRSDYAEPTESDATVVRATSTSFPTREPTRPSGASGLNALAQMEIAFKGSPSQSEIKRTLDQAMSLYGLSKTEDNYSRAGSALVLLTRGTSITEM